MKQISLNLATGAALVLNIFAEVNPVRGERALVPFHEGKTTDLTQLFVAEASKQGKTCDTVLGALKNIKLTKGEAWMSGSTRLVLITHEGCIHRSYKAVCIRRNILPAFHH